MEEQEMSEISDMLKKIGLFGIGVIAITQEKVEEFTKEMVEKGEMSREEGKKFVMEVLYEKDRQIKELGEKINQKVKEAVERSGAATRNDIEDIKKRLEVIEKWKQG